MSGLEELRRRVQAGEYQAALSLFDAIRGELSDPAEQVEAHLLACRAAAGRAASPSSLPLARRLAEEAVTLAEACDAHWQIEARHALGVLSCRTGDWPVAIGQFQHVLSLMGRQTPDQARLADVQFNLGLAYRATREVELAKLYYGMAINAARLADYRACLSDALHNLAWLLLLEGAVEQAEEYITEAGEVAAQGTEEEKASHLVLRALYALKRDDLQEAARLALEAIDPGRGGSMRERGQGHWIMAEVLLRSGQTGEAIETAKEAQDYSLVAQDMPTLGLISDTLARARKAMHGQSAG